VIALEVSNDLQLVTCDEPPVALAKLADVLVTADDVKPGHLLKFTVQSASMELSANDMMEGSIMPIVTGLRFLSRVPPHKKRDRAIADSWSKILCNFQPVQYPEILSRAASEGMAMTV